MIQKNKDIETYLNTAWTVLIVRGVLLSTIIYFVANSVAVFFDTPESKSIIQVMGISIILKSFVNIGIIHLQKDLLFKKYAAYQFSGMLIDFVISVISALILNNVWALVYGLLAGNLILLIGSYVIHSYRPRINLNVVIMKELFSFGKWVSISRILGFFVTQGDTIIVGRLLGATILGYYQMAYRISNLSCTEITNLVSQITFPAYSKIQKDIYKLSNAYLLSLKLITFVSFLIAGIVIGLGFDFTRIVLGDKWLPMVVPMQVLILAGLARSIQATSGPLFYAIGKTKIDASVQAIRFLVLAALVYPLTIKWGIVGTSIAVFFSILIALIVSTIEILKILKFDKRSYFLSLIQPLICTIVTIITLLNIRFMIDTEITKLIFVSAVGILVYIWMTYIIDLIFNQGLIKLIKLTFTNIK